MLSRASQKRLMKENQKKSVNVVLSEIKKELNKNKKSLKVLEEQTEGIQIFQFLIIF